MKYSENNLNLLISFLNGYVTIYQKLAESNQVKVEYDMPQKIAREFIIRHSINVGALIQLLPFLKVNLAHKLPIHLISRSIVSDILTSSTLFTFMPEENNYGALENELNILNRDFIKAFQEIEKEERKLRANDNPIQSTDMMSYFRNRFNNLFEKNELKSNQKLRTTESLKYYKDEKAMKEFHWQEKQKLQRLDYHKYVQVYTLFKYYSQYQHYSPLASELLEIEDSNIDFSQMIISASYLASNTESLYKLLKGSENKYSHELFSILKTLQANLEK